MAFPKKIYVIEEQDRDERYLVSFKSVDEIPEDNSGKSVAVYELASSHRFEVSKDIVLKPLKKAK